jgi:hypothetical protein
MSALYRAVMSAHGHPLSAHPRSGVDPLRLLFQHPASPSAQALVPAVPEDSAGVRGGKALRRRFTTKRASSIPRTSHSEWAWRLRG